VLFHSTEFLFFFLPITWIVFVALVCNGRYRTTIGWLTLASLAFYAWWNPPYLALIAASILFNYAVGRLVGPTTSRFGNGGRAWILVFGLAVNIAALGYFKYANFFVENLAVVFHVSLTLQKVILPLAISFFTFQQIVFLVGTYRGDFKFPALLEYAFAVSFFPHLIAGPIVQYQELLPQIERERWKPVRWENLQVGITIFIIGLFKKMVIADGSATYATPVFDSVAQGLVLSTPDAWAGALAYGFQLYFDFSGYSDMATGLARCFGIVLPLNFDSPYKAASIIDFWRRWHITLSRFLRDYIYIPLGGSRRGIVLRYSNLMITMLVGGLWHGAGWTFVIWGGLHGLYLAINHGYRAATRGIFNAWPLLRKIAVVPAWGLTMLAVIVGWVFFRAADLPAALRLLASMFPIHAVEAGHYPAELSIALLGPGKFIWLAFVALVALAAPSTHDYLRAYTPTLAPTGRTVSPRQPMWHPTFLHGAVIGVLLFITIKRYFLLAPTEFLYFNF